MKFSYYKQQIKLSEIGFRTRKIKTAKVLTSTSNQMAFAISVKALREKIQQNKNVLLIDVTEPEEHAFDDPLVGHLILFRLLLIATYIRL